MKPLGYFASGSLLISALGCGNAESSGTPTGGSAFGGVPSTGGASASGGRGGVSAGGGLSTGGTSSAEASLASVLAIDMFPIAHRLDRPVALRAALPVSPVPHAGRQ